MKEGIYLYYIDFRNNSPIQKNNIQSKLDKEQLDFLTKITDENDTITYLLQGKELKINTDSIWGFCQNNTVYLNYQKNFCRIPVFGNISHFIAVIEITSNPYYNNNPSYYNYGIGGATMPVKTKEVRQFILDFYSGNVVEFNNANFKEILSRDKKLYTEFTALKKRKQKDQIGIFLRRYNDAHPVFFPKR